MSKLRRLSASFVFALVVFSAGQTFAQETRDVKLAEPSYEFLLQVLVGSNAGAGGQTPASLGNVVKQLKATFPFTDYRVAVTYLNRVENGGSLETKGVVQETANSTTPVFQDLSVGAVKKISDASGKSLVQMGIFRFGTRVPVQTGQNVIYEHTGLTVNRLNLMENSPTIIGTLNGPKNSELMVLVLTVRPTN